MDPYRRYRPRNPYNGGRDLGLLTIFFLTFVLLGGVIGVLTVGSAWTLPSIPQFAPQVTRTSALFGTGGLDKPNVFLGSPTPSNANRPPAVTGASPTATPSAAKPSPTPQRTPTQLPSPQASPTATEGQGTRVVIGNTGGVGAWVRRSPSINDYLIAWTDGTALEVTGPDVQNEGRTWKQVRDPQGNRGYIPAEWVVPAP